MNRIMTLCASFLLSCIMGASVFAQGGYEVKGVVVDAVGPIIGATVIEQGTTNGASTGLDGDYVLTVSSADAIVEISCIGYASQSFVASQMPATITLAEDAMFLDDVVVIGYGTVKKGDMTGSVGTVKADEINKGMISSPADLLKGKSAGVVVTPGSGQPGAGSTIRIRGGSSLSATNDPLIIVDGLPVSNDGISGMGDVLSSINPNDIESFSVLKDASATAIYGSRASNGVILITTKKGAKTTTNVPQINFDFQTSVSHVSELVDVMDAETYKAFVQSQIDAGVVAADAMSAMGEANTNWQKEIYQIAPSYEGNLSLAGRVGLGNAGVLPYRVSGGFLAQDGVLKTDHMNRGTVAVNLSPTLFDNHLTINLNGKGVFTSNSWANQSAIGAANRMNPTLPVYDEKGIHGYYTWYSPNGSVNTMATMNPVALLYEKTDKSHANRFIGNAQFDYKIHGFEDLRVNLNLGIDYASSGGFTESPIGSEQSYHDTKQSGSGYHSDYSYKRVDKTLEAYIAYNKDINNHHVDAMAGYSWQHFYNESTSYSYKLTDQSALSDKLNPKGELFLVSFFGRVNYSYDNRYMITATLRRDGTSRFQNNKWGLFPSVALGWNIANEGFLKDNDVLTTLKLRASWGQTGQQGVGGYYDSQAKYYKNLLGSYYIFGGQIVNPLTALGYNADLKWETTTTWNVGLDFGFLEDRITMGLDAYMRETTDLLNYIPVPALGNLTNYLNTNIGSLVNKGIEFEINAMAVDTKNFTWSIGANVAYNNTKITKLTASANDKTGVETGGISGGVGNNIQMHQVGFPPSAFYVYEQVYDAEGHPIEGEYVDRDGNGVINNDDRYFYHKPAADVTMGLNTTLTYKNWTLAASGHGSIGNWVYNNVASDGEMIADCWTNNFNSNRLNSAAWSNFKQACYLSDYYVRDGSFFKIDNITLGYTFPQLFKSAKLDRAMGLNIFATVQNVATFTKYDGLDPEVYSGIDNNLYPRPRTYVLGVKFNF
ncbi:MAG: SusC/RagA family TonB-linked outer membrane protein [Bacteroidales bacterium]|nr:SusC/RagA family TonB-linked outer membrane protein [Bacteroidales bacterium]